MCEISEGGTKFLHIMNSRSPKDLRSIVDLDTIH